MKHKIAIIVASEGKNQELALEVQNICQNDDNSIQIINLCDLDLPLYTTTNEKKGIPPQAITLFNDIKSANGLIFIAPEYNGSTPPTFPNALAWISRSGDKEWREAFNEKPAIIATHSGGGGVHVLEAMQSQLSFIGVNVIARKILTTYSKALNPESLEAAFRQMIKFLS